MPIVNECGQKWYRWSSWQRSQLFRKFNGGFAIGPVMFLKEL